MADIKTRESRSYNMSCIKSQGTIPEEKVRHYLFNKGFRYKKNYTKLPGKPDIVLPKYKTVIFVNGCFWHRHEGCKYAVMPKSNVLFWNKKFEKNKENDKKTHRLLAELGWKVLIVWECDIKHNFEKTMSALVEQIIR